MIQQQILNFLRAAAVADAFGVPVEMRQRGTFQLTGMTGQGTWKQPRGSWSDDTSMTLCLLQNLVEGGSYDDLLNKFEAYMMYGDWTPRGVTFDVGRTCAHAVRNHAINRLPALECGDTAEFANGNGALMRIAPLAVVLQNETDFQRRVQITRNYTVLTHGHPRSVLGSLIFLEVLRELFLDQSVASALEIVHDRIVREIPDDAAVMAEFKAYQRLFLPDFGQLPVAEIKSSSYVVDTLEAALWVALNSDDLKTAILTAVNLGGDTDTIATVTASLIVAKNKLATIPDEWWSQTLNHALLDRVMIPFAEKFAD